MPDTPLETVMWDRKNRKILSDLTMGMKRLHGTFVALAGRLQAVHSQVETQKELYMNIRKYLLHDTSNPFEKLEKTPAVHVVNVPAFALSPPKVASGPTPFSNMAIMSMNATPPQQPSGQPPAYPGSFSSQPGTGRFLWQASPPKHAFRVPHLALEENRIWEDIDFCLLLYEGFGSVGFGASGGTQTSNTTLFGSSSFNQSFNSSFQLQKPPSGTKRGKMWLIYHSYFNYQALCGNKWFLLKTSLAWSVFWISGQTITIVLFAISKEKWLITEDNLAM